jgi:hypothetical protein
LKHFFGPFLTAKYLELSLHPVPPHNTIGSPLSYVDFVLTWSVGGQQNKMWKTAQGDKRNEKHGAVGAT